MLVVDILTRYGSGFGGSIPLIFCFVDLVKLSALLHIEETSWIWGSIRPSTGARPSWWPSLDQCYSLLSQVPLAF